MWDEEGREAFRGIMRRIERAEGRVQHEIKEMGRLIRKALEKVEEERRGEKKTKRGWWDEDCAEKKKEVRRRLREWREGRREGRNIEKRKENTGSYVRGRSKRKTKDGKERRKKQGQKG